MKYNHQKLSILGGWLVFLIALTVYILSAERSGSLWDCGEFILGAYKLQVVHPPGAPLFLLLGRVFAWLGDIFSSNPAMIAFAVNVFSGLSTAAAAMFVAWSTMIFGKLALVGRDNNTLSAEHSILTVGAGVVAGLATAFSSSIWFSAVEGEVYALSTFFTTLTFWAMAKWYSLPDKPDSDRWMIFAMYSAGLSIGVHLLSLLTFPALALLYYFKKYKEPKVKGMILAFAAGTAFIGLVQVLVITGIPKLWANLELLMVNSFGLPFHSGLIPTILIVGGLLYLGYRQAIKRQSTMLMNMLAGLTLIVISYSIIGVVVIRANANTPVNMNAPTDAHRLLPYLNREQYGERPLIRGPHFDAPVVSTKTTDKYGIVGDKYEIVDYKVEAEYKASDQMLFPRLSHNDAQRKGLYRNYWLNLPQGSPSMADNLSFFFRYQIGWMYWRYFMWNFSGRQNGAQGFFPWDKKQGHWLTGINMIDNVKVHNMSKLPSSMKNNKARNRYFMLPFIFGLIGLVFQFKNRRNDAVALAAMFLITGLGIIIYSNQPPNEPRERDYVLVGSFFTYCMWIGLGVIGLYKTLQQRANLKSNMLAPVSVALVLIAPIIMGFQNFDDHSRANLTGARDFANNFLESCEPNAIIFTYGDNDTYPLWYAQEVEGIRTDVRVVNLSLIAVDWYINQMRRKINDSPALKLSIPAESYRGSKRNVLYYPGQDEGKLQPVSAALKYMGETHQIPSRGGRNFASHMPTKNMYFSIDKAKAVSSGWVSPSDADKIESRIPLKVNDGSLTKDELAVLDILNSNMYDRPIYFSVTTRDDKLQGLNDYMRLEGLGLRFVPIKSPSQRQFGIHGNGSIDAEAIYDRVMNKFRWGGFDEHDLFVTSSFYPSFFAHRRMFERAGFELAANGQPEKAVELIDKYFASFPNMNFPYDATILNLLRVYEQAGGTESLKKQMRILANETEEHLEFYDSLNAEDLSWSFKNDQNSYMSAAQELQRLAQSIGDTELVEEYKTRFDKWKVTQVRG
ncbi:MAG: DUF2723 domain-containing protein [Saprospiraceae bacterium]|nr:DUF2723 domain-containing protein [Saprospiraceae bacterium]